MDSVGSKVKCMEEMEEKMKSGVDLVVKKNVCKMGMKGREKGVRG